MHSNSVWPGAYDFTNEIKFFIESFKNMLDSILIRIEETENKLA